VGEPPAYEMSLILRNNAVSDQYPLGVFHAHPEYFFLKQEPIGLIEAMGLFVLPGRLVNQLGALEDALVSGKDLPADLAGFELMWRAARDGLERSGARILGNIAVFPPHEGLERFVEGLGFVVQE